MATPFRSDAQITLHSVSNPTGSWATIFNPPWRVKTQWCLGEFGSPLNARKNRKSETPDRTIRAYICCERPISATRSFHNYFPQPAHSLLEDQRDDVLYSGKGKGESSLVGWEAIRGALQPV